MVLCSRICGSEALRARGKTAHTRVRGPLTGSASARDDLTNVARAGEAEQRTGEREADDRDSAGSGAGRGQVLARRTAQREGDSADVSPLAIWVAVARRISLS